MLNSTQVELKMWAIRLWVELNSKCQLETQLDDQSISAYVFMNKFFAQQHHLLLHQLIHSRRLQEFDDQVTLIDDITHVVEITMILDEHIEKLFFYVIELSQYLIIMSLSWLHHHVIDVNFKHNILILSFFFCLNHCCSFFVKITRRKFLIWS